MMKAELYRSWQRANQLSAEIAPVFGSALMVFLVLTVLGPLTYSGLGGWVI